MSSMIPKPTYRYGMIAISALALLAGCATGDQAPLRTVQKDPQAVLPAFQEEPGKIQFERPGNAPVSSPQIVASGKVASGIFLTENHYFPYEKNALYQLRAAVGSSSTIELQPGETLINYTLGDGSLWIVDDVDGGHQTLLRVEATQPDLSTHLLINTDKRSYLVEATSHQEDAFEATLAWTYPHEQVDQQITAVEVENERAGETAVALTKSERFSWSRWFANLSKTSSTDPRGCRLCRDPDDHGDNNHGRDHDAADHHGKS